jgi:23S rRNA (uracil1939-C5)-methyltransferase
MLRKIQKSIKFTILNIEDAKENSKINKIYNTEFFAGDIVKILNENFLVSNGMPDIIITDPPRAGMHEKVIKLLLNISPEKIVYISCNPATQARDIALMDNNYFVDKIQPVDMFPHTHHVENVMLLKKRDN